MSSEYDNYIDQTCDSDNDKLSRDQTWPLPCECMQPEVIDIEKNAGTKKQTMIVIVLTAVLSFFSLSSSKDEFGIRVARDGLHATRLPHSKAPVRGAPCRILEWLNQADRTNRNDPYGLTIVDSENVSDNGKVQAPTPIPPLTDLLDRFQVVGDISWMLDFAIVGNAKCGTTFLAHYISRGSDQTFMPRHEVCQLDKNRPDQLVKIFYDRFLEESDATSSSTASEDNPRGVGSDPVRAKHQGDGRIRHGLKCPKELSTQHALPNYAKFFPNIDFVVTTRHPVLWFQSFYNYRSYGTYPDPLPPPSELVGACMDDGPYACYLECKTSTRKANVCTDRAKFHHQLSRFGKTPMNTAGEVALLRHDMEIVPVRGKIFLLELGQLSPELESYRNLPRDLADFLRLDEDLPDLETLTNRGVQYPEEERRAYFIDICDDKYAEVRSLLVQIGAEASEWIRTYFLESPDVVVTSRGSFLSLVDDWKNDPCEDSLKMRMLLEAQSIYDS